MADDGDPGDKPKENLINSSDKTSDQEIPIPESENTTPAQENETMEIHAEHLHKAPGNKVWHYFFEFLMLFLAIFSGFIAENWREHLDEHRREKEFIHSIIVDINSDKQESNSTLLQLKRNRAGIDSVLVLLSSPDIVNNSNEAYRLWTKYMGLEVFVSNDRTIQQLKSSGELRLIRNKAVSDRIMSYDQLVKKYYNQSNLMYGSALNLNDYSLLFDFIRLDKNKNNPVPLTEQGKKSLNQAYEHLQLWNRGMIGLISWLQEVNDEATKLVPFIQEEYHIK